MLQIRTESEETAYLTEEMGEIEQSEWYILDGGSSAHQTDNIKDLTDINNIRAK